MLGAHFTAIDISSAISPKYSSAEFCFKDKLIVCLAHKPRCAYCNLNRANKTNLLDGSATLHIGPICQGMWVFDEALSVYPFLVKSVAKAMIFIK